MNNQLSFQGPICICIPSNRHNDISIAVTDDQFHSHRLHSHYSNTIDISTSVLLGFWLFQFNPGSFAWGLCLLFLTKVFFLFVRM